MPGLPLVSMIATNGSAADTMVMLGIPAGLNMTFVNRGWESSLLFGGDCVKEYIKNLSS